MKCQAARPLSLDPSLDPTSRHQIKPNMSDRVGGAGSIETPTQLHWAALADTGPGGFQDR